MHILMVAAENGALNGAKVGGIGDVVRDIPMALADLGCRVSVVLPAYGFLHHRNVADAPTALPVHFGGAANTANGHRVQADQPHDGVTHFVIDHPLFEAFDAERNTHRIYVDDPPHQPFAADATKFALFCLTVAQGVRQGLFPDVTHLHLHDWHAALLLFLRAFHPDYRSLRDLPTVYTIHNLGLQGIRPFQDHASSLHAWFPGIAYDRSAVADPRWDAVNPMALGIRLADRVHTVSPTYAEEVLRPSDVPHFYGGEGLEKDLRSARDEGRLFGILNGCAYPEETKGQTEPDFGALWSLLKRTVLDWSAATETLRTVHFTAHARLSALAQASRPPTILCTSIGRLQPQKMMLLKEAGTRTGSGLEGVLDRLPEGGLLVVLGSGDVDYERFFMQTGARRDNLLFLNGYSDACAAALYAAGDLFLMPSSYEPCGISQMLAMRAGQPCLVHAVGGLRDTVSHEYNGWHFDGERLPDQVDRMIDALSGAMEIFRTDKAQWRTICRNAAATRFSWSRSAERYLEALYAS